MKKMATWLVLVLIAWFGLQANPALSDVQWTYLYHGISGNNYDEAYSIVRGSDGNLYTGGYSWSNGQGAQFTVIKVDPNGNQQWVYQLDGWDNQHDEAWAVTQGGDGNIYAAGVTDYTLWRTGTLTVVSLNTNGGVRWVWKSKLPSLLTGETGELRSITWGADGNLYASGMAVGANNKFDIFVLSLSPSGQLRWTYRYDYAGYEDYSGQNSIVYGTDSNIYVAGYASESVGRMIILSLTNQGAYRWANTYGGGGEDIGRSIAFGSDGNVYCGGTINGHMSIVSTENNGNYRWTYSEPGYGYGYHATRGGDGNLYLGGWINYGYLHSYVVISVNSNGAWRWTYRNPSNNNEECARYVIYYNNAVYSTGTAYNDLAIIKLSPINGSEMYAHYYNGWQYWDDWSWSLALSPGNYPTAYAAGRTATHWDGWDYTVHAYQKLPDETDGGADLRSDRDVTNVPSGPRGIVGNENAGKHGGGFGLYPNTPNPFFRNTVITYSIAKAENVTLKVFNSFGELVKTLMTGPESPGVHRVIWDGTDNLGRRVGAGVYYCRLVAGGTTASRTVVLSK